MKQQAQWLLCVVCALGVSGVVLGQVDGSGGEGGSKSSEPESELRRRKSSSKNEDSQVQKSDGEGVPLVLLGGDDESEEEPSDDSEHIPLLAPEEGALSRDDDEGGSVPETRLSRLLSTTVRMFEQVLNALSPGYGSRVVAEGILEAASKVEDQKPRGRMYASAARKYLDEAEACGKAGKFEREVRALVHFACLVKQIGDEDVRTQLCVLAAQKYLDEAEACGKAGKFEREKEALKFFIYSVDLIGDREERAQLYKSTAEQYFNEAKACEEAGNSRRKMEAQKNYACFLNRQAVCMSNDRGEERLKLFKTAANALDDLANQGHECSTLRAYVHYNAGFVRVKLARDCDKAKEGGEAAKKSELLQAKGDLELAKELFKEVNEAELIEEVGKLLREAEAELSDLNKRLEVEAERKRLEEAEAVDPNKRLDDGRNFVVAVLADEASGEEKRGLLQQAIKTFQEGCKLCSDQGEHKQLKIVLWREIAQTSLLQSGLYVMPEGRCGALRRAAEYFSKIVDEEENPIGVAEAAAETSFALFLRSKCTEKPDEIEGISKEAAKFSKKALENLKLLSGGVFRDRVNGILKMVAGALSLYGRPLIALAERFEVVNLLTELLSKDEVRQCITQRDLGQLYGDLAAYFKTVARCEEIDDQVRREADEKGTQCRDQIAEIEEELRQIGETAAESSDSEWSEEDSEEENEIVVDVRKDTNSSQKGKEVLLSPGATPLVE